MWKVKKSLWKFFIFVLFFFFFLFLFIIIIIVFCFLFPVINGLKWTSFISVMIMWLKKFSETKKICHQKRIFLILVWIVQFFIFVLRNFFFSLRKTIAPRFLFSICFVLFCWPENLIQWKQQQQKWNRIHFS